MFEPRLSVANLEAAQRKALQDLEEAFGCRIVAYRQEAQLAQLSSDGYGQVQKLEHQLGVSLVAYEPTTRIKVAKPSRSELTRLHETERELGFILVAYVLERVTSPPAPIDYGDDALAKLSDEQYEQLHVIEENTGLVLMAYQTDANCDA